MITIKNQNGRVLGEMLQFVLFELSLPTERTIPMALNVQKVKEVVDMTTLSPLPDGTENALGVYDLRGRPVPVIDVVSLMKPNLRGPAPRPGDRILICELQNILVGILVGKTRRLLTCPSADFLPPPSGTKEGARRIIAGLIRRGEEYIPLLDLDSLLASVLSPALAEGEKSVSEKMLGTCRGKRIFVVDDSPIVLRKLAQLFARLGCNVVTATNGSEALEKLARDPSFQLIFTDIEMPVLDGIAMAREIKKAPALNKIPIIFNSALSNSALISDIEAEGLGRYIVKFDEDLIMRHLEIAFRAAA